MQHAIRTGGPLVDEREMNRFFLLWKAGGLPDDTLREPRSPASPGRDHLGIPWCGPLLSPSEAGIWELVADGTFKYMGCRGHKDTRLCLLRW